MNRKRNVVSFDHGKYIVTAVVIVIVLVLVLWEKSNWELDWEASKEKMRMKMVYFSRAGIICDDQQPATLYFAKWMNTSTDVVPVVSIVPVVLLGTYDTVLELGQLVVVGKSSGTVGEVALLLQTGKASPFLVVSRSIVL